MMITPHDVVIAQQRLANHLIRTPLIHSVPLSRQTGADVWLKCECFAEVGSFKARGALNCILHLTPSQRSQGVICASTGNHGAAMAWAATTVDASCLVVVPHGTPDIKMRNMQNAGAMVVVDGADWGESCVIARRMAQERNLCYLEDGEDPYIMAGAGTVAREVVQQLPQVTDLVMPVGGGNFIAGGAIATKAADMPHMRLFGVQSDAAPAVTESMRLGTIVHRPTTSFAGGIATTAPVPQAFTIMQQYVDDMLLVPESSLYTAISYVMHHHGFVVEGAGAAPVAALLQEAVRFYGRTVVLVLSGRNLDVPSLQCALAGGVAQ